MNIVITGANRGIGQALCAQYAAEGHTVTGTSRKGDPLFPLDVTDPDSLADLLAHLGDRPLDLLVCNAGVYLDKHDQLEQDYPPEKWAQTFATNVTGVFLTIRALLPALRRSDAPRIAIISSQMASHTLAPGGALIYRASKAAALNLGRNLASDLKSDNIAVGIYHPGWVRTEMGGEQADISVEESADGLIARFDELSMDSTGCFETWDGREHPY